MCWPVPWVPRLPMAASWFRVGSEASREFQGSSKWFQGVPRGSNCFQGVAGGPKGLVTHAACRHHHLLNILVTQLLPVPKLGASWTGLYAALSIWSALEVLSAGCCAPNLPVVVFRISASIGGKLAVIR